MNAQRFAGLATFAGFQEGIPEIGISGFNLWNLTRDIPGHPTGSTVSEKTLDTFLSREKRIIGTAFLCTARKVSMNIEAHFAAVKLNFQTELARVKAE